jgi:hypothetical protein
MSVSGATVPCPPSPPSWPGRPGGGETYNGQWTPSNFVPALFSSGLDPDVAPAKLSPAPQSKSSHRLQDRQ